MLDIGCHQGELGEQLAGWRCQYYGIDPDLVSATDATVRGHFPEDLPDEWADVSFDHVVALAVLEHVPEAVLEHFLRSVADRLAPTGTLIASVPSPLTDHVLNVLLKLRLIDGMDLDAHDGLTTDQLLEAAERAGLRLHRRERFQLGLNNLFVWGRGPAT